MMDFTKAFDKEHTYIIIVDLTKAFYQVPHMRLL